MPFSIWPFFTSFSNFFLNISYISMHLGLWILYYNLLFKCKLSSSTRHQKIVLKIMLWVTCWHVNLNDTSKIRNTWISCIKYLISSDYDVIIKRLKDWFRLKFLYKLCTPVYSVPAWIHSLVALPCHFKLH